MNKSIKAKLIIGLLTTITIPMAIIFGILAWNTSQQSHESFVHSTTKQLEHVNRTIDTFIQESKLNAGIIALDPLLQRLTGDETSYVGTTSPNKAAPRPDDFLGREITLGLKQIQDSHPNYVDVFLGTKFGGFLIANNISLPADYDPRTRPWYKQGTAAGNKPSITEAYLSTTGEAVISVVQAAKGLDGGVAGVVGVDITLKGMTDLIESIKLGKTGFMILVEDNGTVLADPNDSNNIFKKVSDASDKALTDLFALDSGTLSVSIKGVSYEGVVFTSPSLGWKYFGLIEKSEILEPVYSELYMLGIILAITLVFLGTTIWIFTDRSVVRPLYRVLEFLKEVAAGDFTRRLHDDRKDEIGQIFNALDSTADTLEAKADLASSIANSDLTRDVHLASNHDALGKALKSMTDNLNQIIHQVNTAAMQIDAGSDQVSSSSQALSQGATQQAASLEEITSSMTEIASQTKANAENANQANQLSTQARDIADSGQKQMQDMVEAMKEINDSSQAIGRIIKVIDEIAFQTNLLALNAAVEAARAGRHGKGFAVVAEEVRNLASRSAKAAQETTQLIESSAGKVAKGSEIADRTAESLEQIVGASAKVADLVAEIAAASNEQAEGVSQINTGLSQVDQVTQQNTASAEETASAAEELSSQAAHLRATLRRFRLKGQEQERQITVQSAPRKPLPQATAPRKAAKPADKGTTPKAAKAPKDAWGETPAQTQGKQIQPEDIISLDDNEFGRY